MSEIKTLVSIVLPTYNGAKYIRQAVESCLSQTYRDIELVIVDDGSTDETPDLIRTFQDERLRYVRLERNGGHIAALNAGFVQAKGEFLTWTSDDNYYHPQAIAVMAGELAKNQDVDFVYTPYSIVDEAGNVVRLGRIKPPRELDEDNCIGGCFLYRRKVYNGVGEFSPEAFLAEDYEYWLRVRAKFKMKMLEQDLYFYRMHDKSLTGVHKEEKVQVQVEKIRDRFIAPWKKFYFHAGKFYGSGQSGQAKISIGESLKRNPFYIPSWRLWAMLHLSGPAVERIRGMKHFFRK